MFGKIKVLVVDDALLMRKVVADILNADPKIEVIGEATNGKMALEKVRQLKPDVLTLDVEMPVMDGIDCLKQLMKENPTPVIMVSSVTYEGGVRTLRALDAGAFDFVQKPMAQSSNSLHQVAEAIVSKVKAAVNSKYIRRFQKKEAPQKIEVADSKMSSFGMPPKLAKVRSFHDYVIAVGISTGGPPCVSKIFEVLPQNAPPVLVVQHMPEGFTKAMADRINKVSQMEVREAANGDIIKPGLGLIAPGHSHITLHRQAGQVQIRLSKKGPVSGHQPSADVLFENVCETYGKKSIGLIMTGMGRDGVTHLKVLHQMGAHTIAQSEDSCVVFGMPKIAIAEDAVDEVLSLEGIMLRLKKVAAVG